MNFDQVLDDLYVGSYPNTPEDVERLKSTGITAVVNVQSDDDCRHLGIDWPWLEDYYKKAGMDARRVRIQDFDDEDLRRGLPEAVRVLDDLIKHGHTAYVHCSAGINRSPSTCICYLHWIKNLDLEEAERLVRASRSCDPVMNVIRLATNDWVNSTK